MRYKPIAADKFAKVFRDKLPLESLSKFLRLVFIDASKIKKLKHMTKP